MRTIGISHKTRYWQHYSFSNPPEGYRCVRGIDIPWHLVGILTEELVNTKFFLPLRHVDIYHLYNGVMANAKPWVVEVESYLPRYHRMDPKAPLYQWALRKLAGRHCKALVFTSQWAMQRNVQHLQAAGVDPAKMRVIYRAVEQFTPQGRDPNVFTLLIAGNGFYRKGGAELLRAFQQLGRPEMRLKIISTMKTDWGLCPMPGEKAWVENTIANDPRITVYGQMPHEEVIRHMRAADLFVSTTYADPFNNTVLEAMGCGLPVICSNVGALPEVARHGENGYVLPVDARSSDDIVDELVVLIRQLMDDAALRARMGAANDAIIRDRFSLPVRNAALLEVYEAALEG